MQNAEKFKKLGSDGAYVLKLERKSADRSELLFRVFRKSKWWNRSFIPANPLPGRSKIDELDIFAASLGLLDVYDQEAEKPDGARMMTEAARYLTHPDQIIRSHAIGAYRQGIKVRLSAINEESAGSGDGDGLSALKNDIAALRDELRSSNDPIYADLARYLDSELNRLD